MLHITYSGILALLKYGGCRYKGAWDRSSALMYNFAFKIKDVVQFMEAEQLNQIGNRLTDLSERHIALRGYL
ncbi:MAG TPA: hypothetical protein VGJ90_13605 [Methylophilaceae bacterium]|jgi:hypothetical protein